MRADIVPGALFPDYELTDHTGKHRKLSDLQGPDPMILVLSRGGYCPKDRRQAEGLVQLHHEMEVGYSRLVTISTDNMLLTNEYRTGVGAHWTFLSDPGRKVQKDLDIAEYTDPEHNPMIPHVIVLSLVSLYSRSTGRCFGSRSRTPWEGPLSSAYNSIAAISKEEVQAFYEEFLRALKSADITSLERIYADDYLLVRPDGAILGKKEILADL